MFLKFAPAIKSENAGNTFYDQFYCCTFTMFKNHLTLNFAFSLKKNLWEYCNSRFSHDVTKIQTKALSIIVNILFDEALQQLNTFVYSYLGRNAHATIPQDYLGYCQYTVPGSVAVKHSFVAFL